MLKVGPSQFFNYLLNDPTTPSLSIRVPVPRISDSPLKLEIIGFREGPLVQEDTIRIQAASALYSILSTLSWVNKIRPVDRWAATSTLKVSPRAGKQYNAYYDRFGIHFFYEIHPVTKKIVYVSDSTEAVNHEFGHAILDSFRPDLWNLGNFETFCFHEAFGDIISMVSSLQHLLIIEHVIKETGGDLLKSNVVSRMVEEFGTAICHKDKNGCRPKNCLRDAIEEFRYVTPDTLPVKCPFNVLGREAHNFSRVYSCAWYKLFVEIRNRYHKNDDMASIIEARDIMAKLSLLSLFEMDKKPDVYRVAAESLLLADKNHYGGQHMDLIRKVFTTRNIIPAKVLY